MKLATFEVATPVGRFQRLGVVLPDAEFLLDLNAAYRWRLQQQGKVNAEALSRAIMPASMLEFIQAGKDSWDTAEELLAYAAEAFDVQEARRFKGENGEQLMFHESTVKLLAPLPNPPSLRDFMVFEAHIKRGYEIRGTTLPEEWYQFPVYYKGNPHSIIGPDQPALWPSYTEKLDYELELACIIGAGGRDIKAENAENHIFGYAILNDFSARDIQMREMKVRLGPAKGKDFATGLGPYIVTPDELPTPLDLKMTADINGERWSEGQSGSAYWSWGQMIERVSQDEDLLPGDILGSGTVGGGCGYELGRWIQPGDTVSLSIEGLGTLRNTVTTHDATRSAGMEGEAYAARE